MKTISKNEMNILSGGTSEKICSSLGGAAVGSALFGNLAVAAIFGIAFVLACTKGDS